MKKKFSWIRCDIIPLGGIRVEINDEDYDLTPEIRTIFADTKCNFNNNDMEDESVLSFYKIQESLHYHPAKVSNSIWSKSFKNDLKKNIDKISIPPLALPVDKNEAESVVSESEGMKFIIPSNIIDICTRPEMLLGLKLSGHTDTLTEASNLIEK